MKSIFTLKQIVAITMFIATISCSQKADPELVIDSEIKIEGSRLCTWTYAAEEFQISYAVTGISAGQAASVTSDQEWLSVGNVSANSASFSLSANKSGEDRTATVTFRIKGAKDAFITVLQSANPDYKADGAMKFDLDVSEIESNSAFITVNPSTSSYYYYGVVPASLYDSFKTQDEFLAAHVEAIKERAQADADAFLSEFTIEPYLSKDYVSHKMTGLTPLTDYYLIAFDLSLAAVYSGNMASLKFRSAKFPDSSGDFQLTVDDKANVKVIPSDGIGKYVLDVVSLAVWESFATPVECAEDFIEWVERSSDYTIQSFMHEGEYSACYYNPAAEIGNITTGDYVAYAFGCNGARVTSGVAYKHFHFVEPAE